MHVNWLMDGFSALVILLALRVVFAKQPVDSVLALVFCFVFSAPIWLMLNAEFLAWVLIFVYVGAVMTLFVFVVMMLKLAHVEKEQGLVTFWPFALLVAVGIGLCFVSVGEHPLDLFNLSDANTLPLLVHGSNTKAIGSVLYTWYAYPFELAALLLLSAIVGAIALAFRGPIARKVQVVSQQIAVSKSDRLTVLNMKSEKKK